MPFWGSFEKELSDLINRYSLENASNTPDYILAQYMVSCLLAYNKAVQEKKEHNLMEINNETV